GGFGTICAMPNTDPPADSRATIDYLLRTAAEGPARVLPIGAITKGRAGGELAELGDLADAGAIAFSDDGDCLANAGLMRSALSYAAALNRPIIQHAEDVALSKGAPAHEGWVATRLGLAGQPAAAEESIVARDIDLVALTGGRLHLAHVSTAGAVEHVRRAKERGLPVTAEVTPHHLTLTHEVLLEQPYDTNTKVNPPLRSAEDVAALREALRDGTIDAIATDHAPHALEDKHCEYDVAAFGISGLETAFGVAMTLVHERVISLDRLIEALTIGPVRALGLDRSSGVPGLGTLAEGAPGDIALIDPETAWTVDPANFVSLGKNSPFAGRQLRGRVVATVHDGRVVYESRVSVG
ncbi:MAG TPA: dihydroorotase, partial [Dehalococcoidia bacterium]|nr:dihydroorotase [Dehalococcoidia bacterium]